MSTIVDKVDTGRIIFGLRLLVRQIRYQYHLTEAEAAFVVRKGVEVAVATQVQPPTPIPGYLKSLQED